MYSGLSIIGGSHSPSISSSQSSGFFASGSGMCSGLSQSLGLVSSGSSIFSRSSQSSGFLASGSCKHTSALTYNSCLKHCKHVCCHHTSTIPSQLLEITPALTSETDQVSSVHKIFSCLLRIQPTIEVLSNITS